MKKFQFKKLVRDKILDNMLKDKDENPKYRILNDEEYLAELKKKLKEEADEFLKESDAEEMLSELADIEEIVRYILKTIGKTSGELESQIQKKKEKAGGFDKKIYVEHNEVPDNSQWVDYYRRQPEKYPEIP